MTDVGVDPGIRTKGYYLILLALPFVIMAAAGAARAVFGPNWGLLPLVIVGPAVAAAIGGLYYTLAAGVVALAVLLSRILGLAREQIFTALFGGGRIMDAFTIAFRIPNLLRDLFAEGALSTAFVTVFSRTSALEDTAAAWRLANKVATLAAVTLSAISIAGVLSAPWLVAQPHDYLKTQLQAFASGDRHNDISGQMRNVARNMTAQEIDASVSYYASGK